MRRADRLTPLPCSQKPVKHITHFSNIPLLSNTAMAVAEFNADLNTSSP